MAATNEEETNYMVLDYIKKVASDKVANLFK
jgi:hypothetical protein